MGTCLVPCVDVQATTRDHSTHVEATACGVPQGSGRTAGNHASLGPSMPSKHAVGMLRPAV